MPLFWSVSLSVGNQRAPDSSNHWLDMFQRGIPAQMTDNNWWLCGLLNEKTIFARLVCEFIIQMEKSPYSFTGWNDSSVDLSHNVKNKSISLCFQYSNMTTSDALFSAITKQQLSHVTALALTSSPGWRWPRSASPDALPTAWEELSVQQPDRCNTHTHTQPSSYWEPEGEAFKLGCVALSWRAETGPRR